MEVVSTVVGPLVTVDHDTAVQPLHLATAHRIDSGSHMSAKDRIVSADSGE